MRFIITRKDITSQLQKDLIGKDSHRGVTLTYSWLANQFGHFSLGFVPTVVAFFFLTKVYPVSNALYWSSLGVSAAWLLFEIYNFLKPLLTKSKGDKQVTRPFQPKWGNVAYDTFTDLCFFWVGALSAHLLLDFDKIILYALIPLLLILLYSSFYWFTTKMYQQSAKFPIQFRLSQWEKEMSESNQKAIKDFLENKSEGKQHMLLFGARKSGKTTLAVGLANENSINRKASTYTTAMKVFGLFSEDGNHFEKKPGDLWEWRKASYLVIDDINPGHPITEDIITKEIFWSIISTSPYSNTNIDALINQNVVWVAGNNQNEELEKKEQTQNNWKDFLLKIGIKDSNITVVDLQE